ncbi:MAG: sigma-54-dependent Fis family transcriptional regulator, partial [Nitrospirae bacterium]|nr:sigma-54-dependent Fis family transcriptional regulator [Nitrospirota bacterium]
VDVRIITATNSNLEKDISEGRFREDLFYRLNVFPIFLPPLRERREDIPLLAEHFLSKYNKEKNKNIKIGNKALRLFQQAEWKGNIRELENVIERLVLVADKEMIDADDLIKYNIISTQYNISSHHADIPLKSVLKNLSKDYEKELIQKTLQKNNGNISRAAKELGIARETLHRKIKALNLTKQSIF